MKIVIQTLFILLLLFSYKTETNESTEFINEILSDTTELKIITSKNTLISNFDFTPNHPLLQIEIPNKSNVAYLSELLEEKDTLYISSQLESKNRIDFEQLKLKGFKIIDLKKLCSKKVDINEIRKKASELNAENKLDYEDYFIMLKNPIFNKECNKVYLRTNNINSGKEYVFSKDNGKWKKQEVGSWIE